MKSIAEIMEEFLKHRSTAEVAKLTPQEAMERRVAKENESEGTLHLYDGYNCDKCKNKGTIILAKQYDGIWQDVQRDCSCMRIRKSIRNLKRSGLENVVKDYTLDKFKVDKPFQELMLTTAKRYLSSGEGKWLAFLGASGSGKTMLCSAVAVELLRRGKELKYMLWKDDSRKIKNDNFDGGNLIEYYKNVEVLYIDDLFKTGKSNSEFQKPTAGDINLAFEIINSRVVSKKVTIISSENTIDELFEIDEATAGRIRQMCGADFCLTINKGEEKNYRKRDLQ